MGRKEEVDTDCDLLPSLRPLDSVLNSTPVEMASGIKERFAAAAAAI